MTETPVDGRTARAQRTRAAIVDACLSLVDQGDYRPTAPRIAEEAGVSVRTVFQHYDDLDSLFTAVAEQAVERVSRLLLPLDPAIELGERIEQFVAQRSQLFEALRSLRRAAYVQEPFSETIEALLDVAFAFLRDEAVRTFAPELGDDPVRTEAVITVLGWPAWDSLRHRSKLDVDEASAVAAATVRALLDPEAVR